jgi:Ser-tRNA(Ala) deacylase AlaX
MRLANTLVSNIRNLGKKYLGKPVQLQLHVNKNNFSSNSSFSNNLTTQANIMKKVFWENPYQTNLKTSVNSVSDNTLTFDSTIAFSFSGGQESDKATINGMPIIDSSIEGSLIYYTLPAGHGLAVGDQVVMEIDWQRRYRLMRLHFAAELILEIVTQKYQLEKTGAHIAEHKARIDFIFCGHISTHFEAILAEYNAIIKSNKPIETGFSDIQNQRRYWKIDGFAKVPCGGTHVKSTAEVGLVNLKRARMGKKNNMPVERIEIKLVEDTISSQKPNL